MIDLKTVTKQEPCKHCGKPDWCYRLGNGLEVCNRDQIAEGWKATTKRDRNGINYLSPIDSKKPKPKYLNTQKWDYPSRDGKPLARACRRNFDDGSKKPFREGLLNGKWVASTAHIDRSEIPIYKYKEIREAIANNETIFFVEGEKCADVLWGMGLIATTNYGGSGALTDSDLEDLKGATLVIVPDCDLPGLKLGKRIYSYYPDAQWIYSPPDSRSWKSGNLPPSNGYDIANWIEDDKLTAEQIMDAIEPYRENLLPEVKELIAPSPEQYYTEKAVEALYSDGKFLAIGDDLYRFNGKCYEKLGAKREQRRIADWCRANPVEISQHRWKFSYANASTINNIWAWLLIRFGVEPDEINPPGLNLKNGRLRMLAKDDKVSWELIPHSFEAYYTYCVEVNYDPNCDDFTAKKLLDCLDLPQQIIFLRTLAASLDLDFIRRRQGRAVKGLLLHGDGANGKDSLKEVAQILFGESLVSLGVSDFQQYDRGEKTALVKLANAQISWSSENSQFASLDNLQSLKAAITGDTLSIRELYENSFEIQPRTVFLFNCNELPTLSGGNEAIKQRYAILRFTKTFKKGADIRRGEIEADPRFRYDPDFLKEKVAPAFLNKLLEQFPLLLKEGIDYSPTDEAIKDIQASSNHLWQFCQETGLGYVPDGQIYVKDLWESLKVWYQANGTLEIEKDDNGKEKVQWNDQVNARDKNVKGANQIYNRFAELFPKIKKMSETTDYSRRGQAYLSGLGQTASIASNSDETMITASITASIIEPTIEATTESYRLIEAIEAVLGKPITDAQLIDLFKKRFSEMSPELKQKLINELVSSQSESSSELVKPPIDPKKAKRVKWGGVEYRVGDQNSTSFSLYRAGHPGELFWIQKSLVEIIE